MILRRNIEKGAAQFLKIPENLPRLVKFRDMIATERSLPFPLVLWRVQNRCYEILQRVYPQMVRSGDARWAAAFKELAGLLKLRVE